MHELLCLTELLSCLIVEFENAETLLISEVQMLLEHRYVVIEYNNSICRALFTKRPGALIETSDDVLCEIVQSLNGA